MPRRAARLPDALVGLAPDADRALGLGLDDRPQPPREPLAAAGVQQDAVQHRAVDVVLALVEGAVADPHRLRAGVAGEVVAGGLGEVAPPVDPVHDLHRAVGVGLEVGDVLHELLGLPVEVEPVQRPQGERRVAHPRVAVVPVALAARRLGQRGRRRGHGRPGRHVGQALDREDRPRDRLAELVVGEPRPVDPRAPEARGRGHPRLRRLVAVRATPDPPPTTASRRPPRPRAACGGRAHGRPRSRSPCRWTRRTVTPAPVASALWRPSCSVHSAAVRP